MCAAKASPEPVLAFHTADKTKVRSAVLAMMKELGLNQGSVNALANPLAAYDLYKLLNVYMNDPQARLKIHDVIGIPTKTPDH